MPRMAVGSFQTGTGTAGTNIEVNITDQFGTFQPKRVLFFWCGRDSAVDAVGGSNIHRGFGFADSSSSRGAVASVSTDAAAAMQEDHSYREDACVISISAGAAGADDGLLDFVSMDADGFTVTVDDQFPADMTIHYAAFGGDDLTVMAAQFVTCPAATGNQDVTATGFTATDDDQVCIFLQSPTANAAPTNGTDSRMGIGAVAGVAGANNAVWTGGGNDGNANAQTCSACRAGQALVMLDGNTSAINSQATASFITDAVRINWTQVISNRRVIALPMKGGKWTVGDFTTSTSNGGTVSESGFGYRPHAAIFVSACKAATAAGAVSDDDELSIGAADGVSNQVVCGTQNDDGVADAVCSTSIQYGSCYTNMNNANATEGDASVQSFDADGFTIVMNDGDPNAAFVWYVALGNAPSAFPVQSSGSRQLRRNAIYRM